MSFRIIIGADSAGYEYKEALKADLLADPRVESVSDVGVASSENTDYPHVAVAAARKVADGEASGIVDLRSRIGCCNLGE